MPALFTGSSTGRAAGSEPVGCRIKACPVIPIGPVAQFAQSTRFARERPRVELPPGPPSRLLSSTAERFAGSESPPPKGWMGRTTSACPAEGRGLSTRRRRQHCGIGSTRGSHKPAAARFEFRLPQPALPSPQRALAPCRRKAAFLFRNVGTRRRITMANPQAPATGRASVARVGCCPRYAARVSPQLWCRRSW